jgi:hypothetical protein
MREFQKNKTNIKMSSIQKKKATTAVYTIHFCPSVFGLHQFPPRVLVCRYFDYSKETENENKYFENCETLPPWAGKLHCIRFEQENMVRRD